MSVTVGIRQLRENLRAYLDRVQTGEEVVITDRGKRIGRIVGPSKLDELVNDGVVTPAKRPKKPIRVKDLIEIDGPPWPSEMIIEDRKRGPLLKLYLEPSAFAKLFIAEQGGSVVRRIWSVADDVVCASVGLVELRAVIARRLSGRAATSARRRLDALWASVEEIPVDGAVVDAAARAADRHRLCALDAVHLACAIRIQEDGLVLATWDAELATAARAAGFATVP